jgi:cytochrome bd ubiquinol oxidase subunit I
VTEVGRQPWTVYGLLRTAQSVTPSLTGPDVMTSLLIYMVLYLAMYPAGLAVIVRLIRQGCAAAEAPEPPITGLQPKAPFALTAAE